LTERQSLFELQAGLWDIPELRRLLENVLPENKEFENFRIEHDFVDLGRKALLLNARKVHRIDSGTETILLAIEDVTDRPNSTT
jgi:hypothetical protein